jgi:cytochrome c oxidase cbb3-type subunit III
VDLRTVSWRALILCGALLPAVTACSGRTPSGSNSAQSGNAAPPGIQYEAHIAAGGKPPVGGVLVDPLNHDAAVAKAGESLFAAMNCDGCHGAAGVGWIAPSLADGRWRYGGSDQEVFSSIYFGRPRGMPSFGGILGANGIWNLVVYLKSMPISPNEPTESWE